MHIAVAIIVHNGFAYQLRCADTQPEETSETCKKVLGSLRIGD